MTASVGIAPNMFLAKIASDMNKPDGLTLVPFEPEAIMRFLAPLPISRMWGVGKVTQKKLLSLGLKTIEQLQTCDPQLLERAVGPHAANTFLRLARGVDERQIETERGEKSISNETTFRKDLTDSAEIEVTYKKLIDKVGSRLRRAGLYATTVHLKIRWNDFSTITRQTRLTQPCDDDITLRETGMELLGLHRCDRPVRLIGFGVSGLCTSDQPQTHQLNLFDSPDNAIHKRRTRLSHIADDIKRRYGEKSLRRGSELD